MRKYAVLFLAIAAANAICAQKKIMPVKTKLAAPKVVNFAERAKYQLAHPPVKKKHAIIQKEVRFKPQPVPANALKFQIPPNHPKIGGVRKMKKHSPPPVVFFNGEMDDGVSPPDINGAAGNTYLMETTNGNFDIYTKTGSLVNTLSLTTFFAPLEENNGDPHIVYDFTHNRYVISIIGTNPTGIGCVFSGFQNG